MGAGDQDGRFREGPLKLFKERRRNKHVSLRVIKIFFKIIFLKGVRDGLWGRGAAGDSQKAASIRDSDEEELE